MRLWFSGPRIGFIHPGVSFDIGRRRGSAASATPMQGEFVYVILGDHGHVKIGISANPAARLATLQTGSPFPLSIAWQEFAGARAFEIEQEAHAMLGAYRLAGEWFDAPKEAAIGAVYGAAYRLGAPLGYIQSVERAGLRTWQKFLIAVVLGTIALYNEQFLLALGILVAGAISLNF